MSTGVLCTAIGVGKMNDAAQEQNLAAILELPSELPADFFENSEKYDHQLDTAIEQTKSLVYPLNESGEKLAKADATAINKFAKAYDGFIALTFKKKTESITLWRDNKKARTKKLLDNRQQLINQFSEMREQKLAEIKATLELTLASLWNESNVRVEFQHDSGFEKLIKLTAVTAKGAITAKTHREIQAIVSHNLAEQTRIDSRVMEIENRCLRAEINPPFSKEYLGDALTGDDDHFNNKLGELIQLELKRRAEHEERLAKKSEADKQAALEAQQAEADTKARAKAQDEIQVPQETAATSKSVEQEKPAPVIENGKHAVEISATFKIQVSDRVSDEAVKNHFLSQLPEKLRAAIDTVEAKSC